MVDFAHNPDGYNGIKEFLKHIDSPYKIGLIAGTGDRRDEDIRENGRIAAQMFDHIMIRQENHTRGRTKEELVALVVEGIKEVDSSKSYELIEGSNEESALYAISKAKPGTFIVSLGDAIDGAIEIVQNLLEKDRPGMI